MKHNFFNLEMRAFIQLHNRYGSGTTWCAVDSISLIRDNRTEPACTKEFEYTNIYCDAGRIEVKETQEEIMTLMKKAYGIDD